MPEDNKELKDEQLEKVEGGQITGIPRWVCSVCGAKNQSGARSCKSCGAPY